MLATISIARNTFVESTRQPIVLIILGLSGLLQFLNTWATGFSMGFRSDPGEVSGDNKLLFDVGLSTVFVCGIVLAAFIATAVLSREIENKTVLTVVSKPIPRAAVVLGKFFGVAGAMILASVVMVTFLLLGIKHGVMTTAADLVNVPVVLAGVIPILLALVIGAAGNYLYNWSFAQTALLVLTPSVVVCYIIVLALDKDFAWQPISTDFKPQVTLACACLMVALLVITAVATAASTRLGQVMTIVVCLGVFLLGLLSNFLIGRHVFVNEPIGRIKAAQTEDGFDIYGLAGQDALELAALRAAIDPESFRTLGYDVGDYLTPQEALELIPENPDDVGLETLFLLPGSTYTVELELPPNAPVEPGMPFYYAISPNGVGMATPNYPPVAPDADLDAGVFDRSASASLAVVSQDETMLTVRNLGDPAVQVSRPPVRGDYVFTQPTRTRLPLLGLWSIVPNMHVFWLVDAVSQGIAVPASHVGLVVLYGLIQVAGIVGLAILLFQGRDVG